MSSKERSTEHMTPFEPTWKRMTPWVLQTQIFHRHTKRYQQATNHDGEESQHTIGRNLEGRRTKIRRNSPDDAFKTPAEEVMNDIMKNKSYGSDFLVALKSYCDEKHIALESMIAFVPSKQALSGKELKEDFLRAHLFPNKDTAIETMQLWKKT